MGIPKCFLGMSCFEITFILKDFKTVTGKIVGPCEDERKKYCDDKHEEHKKECCDPCEFILVELTRDAETVLLQEVLVNGGLEIDWVNVEFPSGSCIALNVCDIIYAGVNAEINEEEVVLFDGAVTAAR